MSILTFIIGLLIGFIAGTYLAVASLAKIEDEKESAE